MAGTEADAASRWDEIIGLEGWKKIEEAVGVNFDRFDREYICLLIYLAGREALATLQGAPLSEGQIKKAKAVCSAAGKLHVALRKLDAERLGERLLEANQAIRKERMAEREVVRLQQGQPAPTLLTQIAAEPIALTADILLEIPSELSAAARLLVQSKGDARNRNANAMALRKRLQVLLRTVEQQQHKRAAFTRFVRTLRDVLPMDHVARHLLGSAETAASSVRPSRAKRVRGVTARKPGKSVR